MEHEAKFENEGDQDCGWLIEFSQAYDDGFEVTKRGLDATPMVVKKFNIAANEVMAFTSYQYANKALTAFHFHPDFPDEDRRTYMQDHEEGHELVLSAGSRRAAQRAQFRRVMEDRLSGWGRGLAVSLHTTALYLAAGGPAAR
jgi:hypothetical protein